MKMIDQLLTSMIENGKVICFECGKEQDAIWNRVKMHAEKKGVSFDYEGIECRCAVCHGECFPADLADANVSLMQEAYRECAGMISLQATQEIPSKYNIGVRPLSKVLGWGEHTFSRYYDGEIPSKRNAALLQRVYEDPKEYRRLLCANSHKITKKNNAEKLIDCGRDY